MLIAPLYPPSLYPLRIGFRSLRLEIDIHEGVATISHVCLGAPHMVLKIYQRHMTHIHEYFVESFVVRHRVRGARGCHL